MTYKTFNCSTWQLFLDGDLHYPKICEEDIDECASRLDKGMYVVV